MKKVIIIIMLSIILLGIGWVVFLYLNNFHSSVRNFEFSGKKHLVLGSMEYLDKIQYIVKNSGPRAAFTTIMVDVDKYGNDLDQKDTDNILRFHKLVSSLVLSIGYVDRDMHYFRNKLNRTPKSLKELMSINMTLPIDQRWRLLGIRGSLYHIQGYNGEYNLKFLSSDGYCEAVYNKSGDLLTEKNDPINMGTYNYAAGIPSLGAHNKFDVSPYILWGNAPESSQMGSKNINLGVQMALQTYKHNATLVFQYRKDLFGMQDGRVP